MVNSLFTTLEDDCGQGRLAPEMLRVQFTQAFYEDRGYLLT